MNLWNDQRGAHIIGHLLFLVWIILAFIGLLAVAGMDVESLLHDLINKIPSLPSFGR